MNCDRGPLKSFVDELSFETVTRVKKKLFDVKPIRMYERQEINDYVVEKAFYLLTCVCLKESLLGKTNWFRGVRLFDLFCFLYMMK